MASKLGMRTEIWVEMWTRFIGQSGPIRQMQRVLERLARKEKELILLQGESGVGKGLLAIEIHAMSPRAAAPFITVDCGSLPRDLIESEFFGYEPGAFTGALRSSKTGLFEAADKGTLFLDQIQDLPRDMQSRLLRLLQEGEVRRLGATSYLKVDTRVIATAGVDLLDAVRKKEFREDLYYRLHKFPVMVPALRERDGDIGLLAHHFLRELGGEMIEKDAVSLLGQQTWPGNVRELESVIGRAMLLSAQEGELLPAGGVLTAEAVRIALGEALVEGIPRESGIVPRETRTRREAEREWLVGLLKANQRNLATTAGVADVGRGALYALIRKHGLDGLAKISRAPGSRKSL